MQTLISQLSPSEQDALYNYLKSPYRATHQLPRDLGLVERVGESIRADDSNSARFNVVKWNDRLWRLDGYYSSWGDSTWEDLDSVFEVKAVEVTMIEYRKV